MNSMISYQIKVVAQKTFDLLTQALEDGYSADIVFLDFAKAFDTLTNMRLCFKLESYGIKSQLLHSCKSFLSNREQRVLLGDYISMWKLVISGVPQDSVCRSPFCLHLVRFT